MWAPYLPGLLQFADPVLSGGQSQPAAPRPSPGPQQHGAGDPVLSQLVNRATGGGQAGDPVLSQLVNQALGGGQAQSSVPPQPPTQGPGGGQGEDPMLSQLVNQTIRDGQRRVAEAPDAAARAREEHRNSQMASKMLSSIAEMQYQSRKAVAQNFRA